MNYKLEEVKAFTTRCLGKRFILKAGRFKDEEVTVVGYTDKDGLGDPAVIVVLPGTSPDRGWDINQLDLDDHISACVAGDVKLWYSYVENLIEC
ncbi:hypothetical protein BT638P5_00028 [Bacteroides phage BT638P5]|nr:hypothetical protein BT638P5_00028 [Bacteroides phage BT638P5]